MKNKILFTLDVNFGDDVKIIADNLKDLEDYLINELGWYYFNADESIGKATIRTKSWLEPEIATIEWVKCI